MVKHQSRSEGGFRNKVTWLLPNSAGCSLTSLFGEVREQSYQNLEHSVALHFFVYNFITRHLTLRTPPALKAHVTDHVRTFEELVDLIGRAE
jgi:hypothetical protein